MTQQTPIIGASQSGLQYRTQDNDGKQALLNHHKGITAPTYAEAGCIWLDDSATPWVLKIHDGTDWIVLSEVNATTNVVNSLNHSTDITGKAAATIAATDKLVFSDASDADNLKSSTVQGVIDLIPAGITSVIKQVFTTSGTYTPTTGMIFCDVEVVGGGSGSQGASGTAGQAGGGGGTAIARLTAAQIGASQTVTIGAGGLAGAAGGTSSLGSLAVATGGAAAVNGGNNQLQGALGGVGTVGDQLINGGQGAGAERYYASFGGNGGSSTQGQGGAGGGGGPDSGVVASHAGYGYGSAPSAPVNSVGIAGNAGVVIITEYL